MSMFSCSQCGKALIARGQCYSCSQAPPMMVSNALPTPQSQLESMRRFLAEKQAHIDRLTTENAEQAARIVKLLNEGEEWRERYRMLEGKLNPQDASDYAREIDVELAAIAAAPASKEQM